MQVNENAGKSKVTEEAARFFKIVILKNFAIFTGKNMCWSLFLTKMLT